MKTFVSAYKPSHLRRVFSWLGFRYPHMQRPDGDDPYIITRITIRCDWRDRLRILAFGVVAAEIMVTTEEQARVTSSGSVAACPVPRWVS